MKVAYTMAVVMAGGVLGVVSMLAIEAAIDRYERWRNGWMRRHVCPHCGAAIIIRDYPNGTKARVCINGACGAKWRVRTRGER